LATCWQKHDAEHLIDYMMERALKERIIGAIVLVIFVVLVVPIFLDGPPEEGEIVSERVLLPGQEDQNNKTVVLERERSEPLPAANTPEEPAVEKEERAEAVVSQAESNPSVSNEAKSGEPVSSQPDARIEQKQIEEPPKRSPEPATSSSGMWAVQLGSFSNKENAEKLAADLRKQGYAAFLSQLTTSSGQLHRVRIGPQKDRASAEAMAANLLKVGHKGQVLPHP
jgi:DedD protein